MMAAMTAVMQGPALPWRHLKGTTLWKHPDGCRLEWGWVGEGVVGKWRLYGGPAFGRSLDYFKNLGDALERHTRLCLEREALSEAEGEVPGVSAPHLIYRGIPE